MSNIRGGVGVLPWSGPMLILSVLALSAMPPFGIFRSEFLIVYGALREAPRYTVAARPHCPGDVGLLWSVVVHHADHAQPR
jgi:hydrogenase-4 component F